MKKLGKKMVVFLTVAMSAGFFCFMIAGFSVAEEVKPIKILDPYPEYAEYINKDWYLAGTGLTKVKRPRVIMFMGRVRIISSGRKKAFSIPRMAAAKKALKKPVTLIPSSTYEASIIAAVRISHLMRSPGISVFPRLLRFLISRKVS